MNAKRFSFILSSILLFSIHMSLFGQTSIVLTGSDLKIVGSGDVKFVLSDLNYTNNANSTLNSGTTEVIFKGQSNSTIGGNFSNNFYDIENLKSSVNSTLLGSDLTITRKLRLTSGYLDLNGKTLNYGGGINLSANGQNLKAASTNSKMNFTASSQIPGTLLYDAFENLEISGTGTTVSIDASFDILKDLTIGANSTFTVSDGYNVVSKGNISNLGIINGAGSVSIDATSGDQIITGSAVTVGELVVNKDGGNLIVNAPLTVSGVLNLSKGNIINSQLITIGTSSAIPGSISYNATTGGRITGALRRYFANSTGTNYFFPIGNATHTKGVTVNMSQAPGEDEYITAQYIAGTPQVNNSALYEGLPLTTADGQLIQNYDEEGYWQIDPKQYDAGIDTKNYTISLQMNNVNGVNDYTKTRIIKADGPSHLSWSALAHEGATGSNANYTLTASGTGFSWFNGGGDNNNNPLPVELVSFSGLCEEGIINLTWQTASEFNSSHFDVEKSRDGENWQVLTTLPSAGTSNELISYQTADHNAIDGNNYFRLRQVDNDGKEKLYDPINVSCSEVTTGYFSSFPNPSGSAFQVIVNNKELIGVCILNMVDATGKVIEQREIEVKDGINMFVVNQELTPGIYFLNISNGSKSTPVLRHAIK